MSVAYPVPDDTYSGKKYQKMLQDHIAVELEDMIAQKEIDLGNTREAARKIDTISQRVARRLLTNPLVRIELWEYY